jgi:hypothetical protein
VGTRSDFHTPAFAQLRAGQAAHVPTKVRNSRGRQFGNIDGVVRLACPRKRTPSVKCSLHRWTLLARIPSTSGRASLQEPCSKRVWWAREELNLRPLPCQQNGGNRCARSRSPRSPPTVDPEGKRSLDVQLNALFDHPGTGCPEGASLLLRVIGILTDSILTWNGGEDEADMPVRSGTSWAMGEARRRNHPVARGQRRAERKWSEISRRPTVPCGPQGWRLRSLAFRAVAFEPPCLWALLRPKSLLTRVPPQTNGRLDGARPPVAK